MGWFYRLLDWLMNGSKPSPSPPLPPTPSPQPQPPEPRPPVPPTPDSTKINESFLVLLNATRKDRKLSSMKVDDTLVTLAQSWSNTQALDDIMFHGDFFGRIETIFPNTYAAENVAEESTAVQDVFDQWMNSPPHKANMLAYYTIMGLGMSISASGKTYWTLDLVRN